jgi:hypothetical protein
MSVSSLFYEETEIGNKWSKLLLDTLKDKSNNKYKLVTFY